MAARKPSGGARNRLAVVLSGNAARAASLLGALETLEEAGLVPGVLVGVSGGAVAGALYAAVDEASAARDGLYALVGGRSWQDLVDIDLEGLSRLTTHVHETSGLITGDALQAALLDTPLGHKGFQHLELELMVVATDLNSGREVVFANQSVEAEGTNLPYKLFYQTPADLERVNVATACRASCAAPGLFRPVSLDPYCLVDGSLRLRRALAVAAAQKGVKRILWLHAGLDDNEEFSLVTDYAGQAFSAGLLHALTLASADQFDPHTGDPALNGISVRYVNLGTSGVGPAELTKAQQLYESGRRTVQAILAKEPMDGGKALFSAEAEAVTQALAADVDDLDGPRWSVTVGRGGNDVIAVVDRTPPLQQEFGYEFVEYLQSQGAEKVEAKEPEATSEWSRKVLEQGWGLARLTGTFTSRALYYLWRDLTWGFRTAWCAVQLDKVWNWTTARAADLTLTISDVLSSEDGSAANGGTTASDAPAEVDERAGETEATTKQDA